MLMYFNLTKLRNIERNSNTYIQSVYPKSPMEFCSSGPDKVTYLSYFPFHAENCGDSWTKLYA